MDNEVDIRERICGLNRRTIRFAGRHSREKLNAVEFNIRTRVRLRREINEVTYIKRNKK